MNSKRKGNAGERELAGILREHGYDSRRGLQYQGGQVEADVVGIPGIHIEVKRVERFGASDLYKAMEQSTRDAKEGETPVVMHRTNRHPWLVTMLLEDWLNIERRTL